MLKTSLRWNKMNFIEKLPLPVTGIILALISLGVICSDYHPYLKYIFDLQSWKTHEPAFQYEDLINAGISQNSPFV